MPLLIYCIGEPHGGTAIEASDSGMAILDHLNTAGDPAERCFGREAGVEQCRPVAETAQAEQHVVCAHHYYVRGNGRNLDREYTGRRRRRGASA